jgi:hypothetical protein
MRCILLLISLLLFIPVVVNAKTIRDTNIKVQECYETIEQDSSQLVQSARVSFAEDDEYELGDGIVLSWPILVLIICVLIVIIISIKK